MVTKKWSLKERVDCNSIFSGRILTGCFWFCILIWISSYTANLAAFLTVAHVEHPISKLEDIISTSYQVGVNKWSGTYTFLKASKYEIHQKIRQRIERDGNLLGSIAEGVTRVRESDEFVFIAAKQRLQQISNQPPCDLKIGKYRIMTAAYSKPELNKLLLIVHFSGSEVGVDLVLIQTLMLFICKCELVSARTTGFTCEKQEGLYQNKVNSSFTFNQRPGH